MLQGVLLQVFTQPVSDRPTVFLEIIQRIGCMKELTGTAAAAMTGSDSKPILSQAGGCGGFHTYTTPASLSSELQCLSRICYIWL